MSDLNFIETQPIPSENRYLGRDYLPSSVSGAAAAPVQISEEAVTSAVTINNNTNTTFFMTLVAVPTNTVLVSIEYAIFVGSATDNANLLPGGSNVNPANWPLVGPIDTPYTQSSGILAGIGNFMSRVNVNNSSGSNAVVTVKRTYKYLINEGGVL